MYPLIRGSLQIEIRRAAEIRMINAPRGTDSRHGEEAEWVLPLRHRDTKGNVAICSFRDRGCPRFDLTHEMLIFDGKGVRGEAIEKIDVSHVSPEKILRMVVKREVKAFISGDIQEIFREMFHRSTINVIWEVTGEVHDVVVASTIGVPRIGIDPLSAPKSPR